MTIHGQDPREKASKELAEKLVGEIVSRLAERVATSLAATREARKGWATLIRQVYEANSLRCTRCGAELKIITFIERHQTDVIRRRSSSYGGTSREDSGPTRGPPSVHHPLPSARVCAVALGEFHPRSARAGTGGPQESADSDRSAGEKLPDPLAKSAATLSDEFGRFKWRAASRLATAPSPANIFIHRLAGATDSIPLTHRWLELKRQLPLTPPF